MAASWDKALLLAEGKVIAVEARAKYNQAQREGNTGRYFGLEPEEWLAASDAASLDRIFLVAPSSTGSSKLLGAASRYGNSVRARRLSSEPTTGPALVGTGATTNPSPKPAARVATTARVYAGERTRTSKGLAPHRDLNPARLPVPPRPRADRIDRRPRDGSRVAAGYEGGASGWNPASPPTAARSCLSGRKRTW